MSEPQSIIVKFIRSASPHEEAERIQRLLGNSVRNVHQIFPDEEQDEELATLYEFELEEDAAVTAALESLQDDQAVEYAHRPEERGPR